MSQNKNEKSFRGIILYDIQLDGNLTGVYTNNHDESRGQLRTEYAHIKEDIIPNYRVDGEYEFECSYFDHVANRTNARLKFKIHNRIIYAEWYINDGNELTFSGEGFQMNERQLAISYWSVDSNQ